jgi:hypothetical protein
MPLRTLRWPQTATHAIKKKKKKKKKERKWSFN